MRRLIFPLVVTFSFCPTFAAEQEESLAPESLKIPADGSLKFGALLQGWWVYDYYKHGENTFRLRRAELLFKGDLAEGAVFFGVMVDPAKVLEPAQVKAVDASGNETTVTKTQSPIAALQDFFVGFSTPYADVSIGQFKIPVSYEGFHSSGELIFAERALLSRGLGTLPGFKRVADDLGLVAAAYGDKRDLGLKIEKKIGPVYYFAGLFNGSGANNLDKDSRKDIAVRVELFLDDWLVLGTAGYSTIRQSFGNALHSKDRFEFNFRLDARLFLAQGEYIYARDFNQQENTMTPSQGAYLAAATRLPAGFTLAGRFGWWDLDTKAKRTEIWESTAGVHYYFRGFNANLKLDYGYYHPTLEGLQDIHEVILAAQVKF